MTIKYLIYNKTLNFARNLCKYFSFNKIQTMHGKPFKHNFCNSFSVSLYYALYNGCAILYVASLICKYASIIMLLQFTLIQKNNSSMFIKLTSVNQ